MELNLDTVELLTLLILPAFMALDLVHRAEPFAPTRWWRLRGLLVSIAVVAGSIAIATLWGHLLGDWHLIDGEALLLAAGFGRDGAAAGLGAGLGAAASGSVGASGASGAAAAGLSGWGLALGTAVGVLVYELGHYAWHRAEHHFDGLWRWSHQMHHSAESLDAFGANYLSPLDLLAFTSISSLVFFPLLGLPVACGVYGAAFLAFNAAFQHANIRTPVWLGYLIQRPESHSVHHGRGIHRDNYADLPIIDMAFGTFCNPKEYRAEVGLGHGASARLGSMLIGRDVSEPVAAPVPETGVATGTATGSGGRTPARRPVGEAA